MAYTTAQLLGALLTVDGRAVEGGAVELPPNARLLLDVLVEGSAPGALLNDLDAAVAQAQAAAASAQAIVTGDLDPAVAVLVGDVASDTRAALNLIIGGGGGTDFSGTGFPEGVVTATVGKTYRDTNATNGAVLWVKATGTGNTGWQVTSGDTGWRTIALVGASGTARIRRIGGVIHCAIATTANTGFVDTAVALPNGWQPVFNNVTSVDAFGYAYPTQSGAAGGSIHFDNTTSSGGNYRQLTPWPATILTPWPATLIGTAL